MTPGTGVHGSFYSYRDVYLDLDPLYRDHLGRPLVRITIDFHDNEIKQNAFLTDKFAEIIKAMGAKQVVKQYRKAPYDVTQYQTTHLCGGAIMGTAPSTSATNRYLQSWDVPNLFVMGASAFPQNAGYNPTGTVAALAYWSADAIRKSIPQEPGTSRPCLRNADAGSRESRSPRCSWRQAWSQSAVHKRMCRARAWTRRTSFRSSGGGI